MRVHDDIEIAAHQVAEGGVVVGRSGGRQVLSEIKWIAHGEALSIILKKLDPADRQISDRGPVDLMIFPGELIELQAKKVRRAS